jgi:DNA-binding SARP family transcriptional activator
MTEEAPPASLAIRLFGSFEARVGGVPLRGLRTRKGEWLLALLVLRPEGVERDWLAATLRPDAAASNGRYYLRRELDHLRRSLGAEAVRLCSPTPRFLSLDLADAWTDVGCFDAAIARGAPSFLQEAVVLYRGPLLADCFEAWAFEERERREQVYLKALETLAAQALAAGDVTAAEQ